MRRAAVVLPALLLLMVASLQMTLARTTLLSPWKGGGFGMFAAVDGVPFRWLRIYVTARDRSEELAIPASLADRAHRTVTWPLERSLKALAQAVLEREQRRNRPANAVRVEVWRADVSRTLELSETLIAHATVHASAIPSNPAR